MEIGTILNTITNVRNETSKTEAVKEIVESKNTSAQYDSFEKSTDINEQPATYTRKDLTYERFLDLEYDKFHTSYDRIIYKGLEDFYAGRKTKKDVIELMKQSYESILAKRDEIGEKAMLGQADRKDCLNHVIHSFLLSNVWAAVNANDAEGKNLNLSYANHEDLDYVYYNSSYYYQWKEMKNLLLDAASEFGTEALGSEYTYEESTVVTDFNKTWNFVCCNEKQISKQLNLSQEPPKDFKFFYKASAYADDKNPQKAWMGQIILETKESRITTDVPYPILAAWDGRDWDTQIFNVKELFEKLNLKISDSIKNFLNNFLVFTRMYGHSHQSELREI